MPLSDAAWLPAALMAAQVYSSELVRVGLQIDPFGHFAIISDSWTWNKGSGRKRRVPGDRASHKKSKTRKL
jgi:hypothetical protein